MDSTEILKNLKELTLDLAAGKRTPARTVLELHGRIEGKLVYDMAAGEPQRDFITQVYVSLENLLNPDFPPSADELSYYVECFKGKQEFKLDEVRKFELVLKKYPVKTEKEVRPAKNRVKKPYRRPDPNHKPKSGKINRQAF